jgi:hypothetical protein
MRLPDAFASDAFAPMRLRDPDAFAMRLPDPDAFADALGHPTSPMPIRACDPDTRVLKDFARIAQ